MTKSTSNPQQPLPDSVLVELFNFVARELGPEIVKGCDNTLRFTQEFTRTRGMDEDRVIAWLRAYGGHCDCEVLLNIAYLWHPEGNGDTHDGTNPEVDPSDLDTFLERLEATERSRMPTMRVEFFEGRGSRQKAAFANTDALCAVAVTRLRHGAKLEVDRGLTDLGITPAAFNAMMERFADELPSHPWPKPHPRTMFCAGPDYGIRALNQPPPGPDLLPGVMLEPTQMLHIVCREGMVEGWKAFLGELLSCPESWERRDVKLERERERKRKEWAAIDCEF